MQIYNFFVSNGNIQPIFSYLFCANYAILVENILKFRILSDVLGWCNFGEIFLQVKFVMVNRCQKDLFLIHFSQ